MERCMEVAKKLMLENQGENVAISPLSLNVILNMMTAFAHDPEERKRLLGILQCASGEDVNRVSKEIMSLQAFGDDDDVADKPAPGSAVFLDIWDQQRGYYEKPVVYISNAAWMNESFPLHPSSHQTLKTVYKSPIRLVNLQEQKVEVSDEINAWVKNTTKGLIQNIMKPDLIKPETNVVLVNTLYFKAGWQNIFYLDGVKDFYLLNGQKVSVPFMSLDRNMNYGAFDGFTVVTFPYHRGKEDNRFLMYIFLPNERDGLPELIKKMGSEPGFLNQCFELRREEFEYIYVPKFKFSYGFKPTTVLQQLGYGFELGGQTPSLLQKVSIDVNEVGTEGAAAVIAPVFGCAMPQPPKVKFLADHPFLFMVREEKTRQALFVGAVQDPSEGVKDE